ncbi:MAG: glycosyltransferase family 2 protein [Pseudomonadota bacterium]|nr:glycosyltransferase family 2 protein [Pseudomonadota bacterium]
MLPSSLTVSVVTFHPDRGLLARCLETLAIAIARAQSEEVIRTVAVALIDNSQDPDVAQSVAQLGQGVFEKSAVQMTYRSGHSNVGYGIAHNLMLNGTGADYQLVLNPDVELEPAALAIAIRWLDLHPEVGVVAPAVLRVDGTLAFLCRRYPAVVDLLLRGFGPRWLRWLFRRRLTRYEMRDRITPAGDDPVINVPIMSGCCMLVRRTAIDRTGGFDPGFFLYFEDYDWSVRLNQVTQSAYLPTMRVLHHGGHAARKGWRHIFMFVKSGIRFYNKHGWRWW